MGGRQGRRFRWAWASLLVACVMIAAVMLAAVAYPFRYVNDWMPLTEKTKAVALAHEARALTASIQDPLDRVHVLSGEVEYSIFPGIAEVLARAGRRGEALQVARQALALALRIENEDAAAGSLPVVAQIFVYIGEPTEAISIARTTRGDGRVIAFAAIIDAEARAGRTSQAAALMPELVSAARGTEGGWKLRYFLHQVTSTLAQAGLHNELQNEMRALLTLMKEGHERDFVRHEIAVAFARAGRTAEALSMARAAEDAFQRAVALATVGQGLASAGRREDAWKVIDDALMASRALPGADLRASALSETARALVDAGRPVDAASVAREARETARHTKDGRATVIYNVAFALAYAGKVPEAVKALLEGRDPSRFGDWPSDDPFDLLVKSLIESRRLAEALVVAEAAPNANQRIVRLNGVARAFVKDGQKAAAIRVAHKALELTSRLAETELMDAADAAVTLARAGAKTEALRVVRQALVAEGQGRGHYVFQYEHRQVLFTIAEALALGGDPGEAARIARRAEEHPGGAGLAMITEAAEAGATAAAVDLARAIRSPAMRAQALTAVASVILRDEPFPMCCQWLP